MSDVDEANDRMIVHVSHYRYVFHHRFELGPVNLLESIEIFFVDWHFLSIHVRL